MDDENIDDSYNVKVIDYIGMMKNGYDDESIAIEMEPIIHGTPSVMGTNDFLFSRFIPTPQQTDKGIEAVKNLSIASIAERVGMHGDNETVENFLESLKDAYILMVKSIVERYEETAHKSPRNYPEFEIYDSVHAIIEDDELIELNSAFSEVKGTTVEGVSSAVYRLLDEMFCGISEWNETKINEYRDVPSIY